MEPSKITGSFSGPAIQVVNLSKAYGELYAVNNLNFTVQPGEIFGLLGPNGAGKTTFILLLLGLIPPTGGQIFLFGEPLYPLNPSVRRRLGVVLEQQNIYADLTAQQYLALFGKIYGVENIDERIGEVLNLVGLAHRRYDAIGGYSRGMKLKLGMARAVLHDPDILIMDEPVEGLDPTGILEVRNILLHFHERGKTILFSSHILTEVEKVADRVGILNHGKLLAMGDIPALKEQLEQGHELLLEVEDEKPGLPEILSKLDFVKSVSRADKLIEVGVAPGEDHRADLARAVAATGAVALNIRGRDMSLEQAFTIITSEKAELLAAEAQKPPVEEKPPESALPKGKPSHRPAGRGRVFSALFGHATRSLSLSYAPYVMLALSMLVAAAVSNSYLAYISRNDLIVLPRPWLLSIVIGSYLVSITLGLASTLSLSQERTSGTLQVLFFGPVDEPSYILSLFFSRVVIFIAWLLLYLVIVFLLGVMSGLTYNWSYLLAASNSVLPVIILAAIGLFVAAAIRSVRGALFTFLGITVGLASMQFISDWLFQLAVGQTSFALAYLSQILASLTRFLTWLSPFGYLIRGLDAATLSERLTLITFAGILTTILLWLAMIMLRRRTVTP